MQKSSIINIQIYHFTHFLNLPYPIAAKVSVNDLIIMSDVKYGTPEVS